MTDWNQVFKDYVVVVNEDGGVNCKTVVGGLTVLLLALYWTVLRPRRGGPNAPPMVSSSPKFPFLPSLIGIFLEFLQSPNDMMTRCAKEYGPVFTIPLFFQRMTILMGPQAQELFYKSNDSQLSQDECYHFMTAIFGPNVVYDAPKAKRQVQFQTMANGLRTARMKTYVSKIEYETKLYCQTHWKNQSGTIDLYKALSELTILTASRCLHGDDVREHMFEDLQSLYHDLDAGLTPLTVLWSTAPTAAHAKRDKARKQLIQLFRSVIQRRREHPERAGDGSDILTLFMDIVYKDGTKITDEEVTGLLISLLFAGQHTSCTTSTWTMLYILHHPHIMQRVLQEQEEILKTNKNTNETTNTESSSYSTGELDFEMVRSMELLHNCMREALRMCPTFIMLLRKSLKDLPLTITRNTTTTSTSCPSEKEEELSTRYIIPKGDLVVVSPTVSMRLPTTFSNPNTFDPDRFGPDRQEHKIPYAYLGFGGGMHSCMGQVFAFLQVKTILSVLLRDYHLELEASTLPNIGYNDMVVGPKGNCNVKYTKK